VTSVPLRRSDAQVARNAVAVALGLGVAQVLAYGFTVACARLLGPAEFGALSALLALILIANVVALGVQAAGARRLATCEDAHRSWIAAAILARTWRWALATSAAAIVASPALASLLHVPVLAVVATGLGLVPLVIAGALLGTTQGVEAMGRLGALHALLAAGKAAGGLAAAVAVGTVTATVLGYAAGLGVAVLVGAWVARPGRARSPAAAARLPGFDHDTAHAAHALLALFVLGSADLLLARAWLSPQAAGEYAVGAVVAKIAFWLPQFVVQVAFPRMATAQRPARTTAVACAAVAVIGAGVVAATAALEGRLVTLIGGPDYAGVTSSLWLFAATGSMIALAQVLLYDRLARDERRAALVVWGGVVVLVVLVVARFHTSVTQIIGSALTAATAVVAVGSIGLLRSLRHPTA
jgi:O-antigen/teichoic acid export membrane protein